MRRKNASYPDKKKVNWEKNIARSRPSFLWHEITFWEHVRMRYEITGFLNVNLWNDRNLAESGTTLKSIFRSSPWPMSRKCWPIGHTPLKNKSLRWLAAPYVKISGTLFLNTFNMCCQVTRLRLVTWDFCITCDFQNPILTFPTHSIYTLLKNRSEFAGEQFVM